MPAITAYIPGPYQGVSQAPPQDRLEGTCEDMQDCTAFIPHGVQKRPPLRLLAAPALLGGFKVGPSPLLMEIPRGSPSTDVTLLLNLESGVIVPRLWYSATGEPISLTVTAAAQTYLDKNNPTQPNQNFRAVAVEDYTFITNRTVTVANGTATAPTRNPEAILWCKTGQYGRGFGCTVTPSGGTAKGGVYTTPSGATSADALWVDTGVIINELYQWGASPTIAAGAPGDGLPTADGSSYTGTTLNALSGINLTVSGSTIYMQSTTSADFTISTKDGQGNTAMYAIKGSVQNFSDLPLVGYAGFTIEIAQEAAGGNSNYWVSYSADGTAPTGGVWTECVAPGANLGLDPTTMPIAITVNETTGAWKCDAVAWTGRTTGDTTTSPDPGFIGDQITDIRWFRGRLLLIYNGGATLSASDSPFKFYTTTLATALDSDPIGFLTPVDRKTFFKQGITFDQRFFVFADRCQAGIASGGAPLTAGTGAITTMAESAFSDLAPIQKGNHKIRYLANRSTSAIVYQLAIDRLSGLALEEDQSWAVPQYLPPTIDTATTWEADFLTIYGTSGSSILYVSNYREKDYNPVQNAYYRWNLPTGFTLAGMYFKLGVIYILIQDANNNPYFCTIDTTPNQIVQGRDTTLSTVPQFLDFMVDDSLVSPTVSGLYTVLTLPFAIPAPVVSLRASWNGYPEGYVIPLASYSGTTLTLMGNFVGAPLWIGCVYSSFFIPSEWYYLGQDKKPQHDGRLSMKRLKADIAMYGYIRAEVTVKGRATRLYPYAGYQMDDPATPINAPPNAETIKLDIPLAGKSHDVLVKFISDTNLGFKMVGYEWRADWNPRSRRTT